MTSRVRGSRSTTLVNLLCPMVLSLSTKRSIRFCAEAPAAITMRLIQSMIRCFIVVYLLLLSEHFCLVCHAHGIVNITFDETVFVHALTVLLDVAALVAGHFL